MWCGFVRIRLMMGLRIGRGNRRGKKEQQMRLIFWGNGVCERADKKRGKKKQNGEGRKVLKSQEKRVIRNEGGKKIYKPPPFFFFFQP